MVVYNYSGKEINAKIVYYGPALSGKTTNLEWIYSKIPVEYSGKMVSLRTQADRTIFFDFLPLDLGMIDGFRTRFMLYTVPGQVHYNATRKMVLKGVDGLVFVADSEPGRMKENFESLQNLRDNLLELGMNPDTMPLVMQWNKRDLPHCMSVTELETELNPRALPSFEACALTGEGVYETLHKVCRLMYTKLTGAQAIAGEEDPPLFGDSIAQCLQEIDVPQPEPERVAIGADSAPVRMQAGGADPLGAILGRQAGHGPGDDAAASNPRLDPPTREIRPASGFTAAAGTSQSYSRPGGAAYSPHSTVGDGGSDDDAQRLGGMVDEVLSALGKHDDVASVDRAASRPMPTSGHRDAALGERLDHFFDGMDAQRHNPSPAERPSRHIVPSTPPNPSSGSGGPSEFAAPTIDEVLGRTPAPSDGMAVEHDVDVFEELHRTSSGRATPVAPDPDADIDLDAVLQEGSGHRGNQDLEIITDPRKLPGEVPTADSNRVAFTGEMASTPFSNSVPTSASRVIEVPLSIDASLLEEGGPIRIVLNIDVRR